MADATVKLSALSNLKSMTSENKVRAKAAAEMKKSKRKMIMIITLDYLYISQNYRLSYMKYKTDRVPAKHLTQLVPDNFDFTFFLTVLVFSTIL